MRRHLPVLIAGVSLSTSLAAQTPDPRTPLPQAGAAPTAAAHPEVCLGPTAIESVPGNATTAANAVREAFANFLTGPSLSTTPLNARLESQAREEAKQRGCRFVLFTTLSHQQKRSGGGLLGRMAGGAVQQGAWEAGVRSGSAAGRIAGTAVYGAAGTAIYDYATSVKNKDEMTLGYRLESGAGAVAVQGSDKRKAKSDNEDLLTPLVQKASEAIAAAVSKSGK